jgi:ferrous iron transport protein A
VGRQLSVISYQLSVISYQLSVINHQSPITNHQSPITNHQSLRGGKMLNSAKCMNMTYLKNLPVGAKGHIVGYDKAFRGYIGKLFSMGLKPGTEFTVIRQAFFEYPLQIEVAGNLLNLYKPEAEALCVEELDAICDW